mmetsp:Transcript_122207/g.279887  ORF Transcript_122207/g.279887 Transcript_122207/m.279887 type:complete len:241 (-) Transcript_122207:721-1443(-)
MCSDSKFAKSHCMSRDSSTVGPLAMDRVRALSWRLRSWASFSYRSESCRNRGSSGSKAQAWSAVWRRGASLALDAAPSSLTAHFAGSSALFLVSFASLFCAPARIGASPSKSHSISRASSSRASDPLVAVRIASCSASCAVFSSWYRCSSATTRWSWGSPFQLSSSARTCRICRRRLASVRSATARASSPGRDGAGWCACWIFSRRLRADMRTGASRSKCQALTCFSSRWTLLLDKAFRM